MASEWQPIETAPDHETVIASDGEAYAKAHRRDAVWMLGGPSDSFDMPLDFNPRVWLPWSFDRNPLREPFPVWLSPALDQEDGRGAG